MFAKFHLWHYCHKNGKTWVFFPCMSICLVIFLTEQYISAHARKTKTTGSEHFSVGHETYRQDFAAIWNRLP